MSNIIHQIARCYDCDKTWEDHKNGKARKQARAHAKKTGHFVLGETGIGWRYNDKKMKK
jgi:hypothetical protein